MDYDKCNMNYKIKKNSNISNNKLLKKDSFETTVFKCCYFQLLSIWSVTYDCY